MNKKKLNSTLNDGFKMKTIYLLSLLFLLFFFCFIILFKGSYAFENDDYIELQLPESNGAYFNNLSLPESDAADPYLLKKDNTYYLYSTSCTGVTISYSDNFKDWSILKNNALEDKGNYLCLWAPEVYYYNNKYYMFMTARKETLPYDVIVAVADTPEGPFIRASNPINTKVAYPLDPNVFFDDDGKIYLYTRGGTTSDGNTAFYVEELNNDLLSVKDIEGYPKRILTMDATNTNQTDTINYWERFLIEGSFTIKENGKYYLMYSTGTSKDYTYALGYAVSDSPTGNFIKKTLGNGSNSTSPLLHGSIPQNNLYDSTKYIYGTGHNSIYKVSNDEMYIAYHSIVGNGQLSSNNYPPRKINFDYFGIDSDGNLFVNGPSTTYQPLPSGNESLYKVSVNQYTISNGDDIFNDLNDNINYNVLNTSLNVGKDPLITFNTVSTSSVRINLNSPKSIEDVWIFGIRDGFQDAIANVIINDKYIIRNVNFGSSGTFKLQLPSIDEYVNSILLNFSREVVLSEISLYSNNELRIDGLLVDYDSRIISNILAGETYQMFLSKINVDGEVKLISNELEVNSDSNDVVKTGDRLVVTTLDKTTTYTLSVLGDVDGNGNSDIEDAKILAKAIIDGDNLSNEYLLAGDLTRDNRIKMNDVMKLLIG